VDESDALDADTWYPDGDGDGYGDSAGAVESCQQPVSYVDNDDDCNDADTAVNPGAVESCDGLDNDCNGTADGADAVDAATWYADTDGDGYGDGTTSHVACSASSSEVADNTDCNDSVFAVNPGAQESCDGIDNDCDGTVDENDAVDASTGYADADSDGYGDPATLTTSCTLPSSFIADGTDCDDTDSAVNPAATELCGDGVDNDCDGVSNPDVIGASASCPGTDCSAILAADATSATGSYWIDPASSAAFEVVCDMDTSGGGWTRIASYDFSVDACPGLWAAHGSEPLCYRNTPSIGDAISATFPSLGVTWSEVLGSFRARQYHTMDAFGQDRSDYSVEEMYVDGISVTVGAPGSREHLFTLAVGITTQNETSYACPSQTGPAAQSFVGSDYLCDSGNTDSSWTNIWYARDIFVGQWFEVDRGVSSTEEVEARLMSNQDSNNEDVGVEWMELYVR